MSASGKRHSTTWYPCSVQSFIISSPTTATFSAFVHIHPLNLYLALSSFSLILPSFYHGCNTTNASCDRRSQFLIIYTPFRRLGSYIYLGFGEQSHRLHHCWSGSGSHRCWCCILPNGFGMSRYRILIATEHGVADKHRIEGHHSWSRRAQEGKQEGQAEKEGRGEDARCRERSRRVEVQNSTA
jgi:hypothetical protein